MATSSKVSKTAALKRQIATLRAKNDELTMKNRVLLAERPKTLVVPYLKDVDKDTFLSMMLDSTMNESLRELIVRAINVYYQSSVDNVYDNNGNITAIVIGRQ